MEALASTVVKLATLREIAQNRNKSPLKGIIVSREQRNKRTLTGEIEMFVATVGLRADTLGLLTQVLADT